MKKIIIQLPDRYSENNTELMAIRNRFQKKIEEFGGLDNCRENLGLIEEMEEMERCYDDKHESIIDRFLYHGTVHWSVEKYDETKETIHIYQMDDGYELLKKKPIKK